MMIFEDESLRHIDSGLFQNSEKRIRIPDATEGGHRLRSAIWR